MKSYQFLFFRLEFLGTLAVAPQMERLACCVLEDKTGRHQIPSPKRRSVAAECATSASKLHAEEYDVKHLEGREIQDALPNHFELYPPNPCPVRPCSEAKYEVRNRLEISDLLTPVLSIEFLS